LAYLADGPVFELGTSHGLSASILAQARRDSGKNDIVHTVDLSRARCAEAKTFLAANGVSNVDIHHGNAIRWLKSEIAAGHRYGFAFIDHSHEYAHVRAASAVLHKLLPPGAYVAFHDFIDKRNFDDSDKLYGVFRGARDGLGSRFFFVGASGCTGVYRRASDDKSYFRSLLRAIKKKGSRHFGSSNSAGRNAERQ
jgi:predicted O-methyltransferase YrrM